MATLALLPELAASSLAVSSSASVTLGRVASGLAQDQVPSGLAQDQTLETASLQAFLAESWQAMEALAQPLETFSKEAYPQWACSVPRKHKAFVSLLATKLCGASFAKRKPASLANIEAIISKAVAQQLPIPIRLGHGPLKNPNLGQQHALPEWAEWFAMLQLARWVQAIRFLYPPALSIQLVLDNCRACCANGVTQQSTQAYRVALQGWLQQTPLANYVEPLQAQEVLYEAHNVLAFMPLAEQELSTFWQSEPGQTAFEQAKQNALFNLEATCRAEAQEQGLLEQVLAESAKHYLCLHRSEELAGLWSCQKRIPVRYGRHAGYTQLFTLCKEETALPWQGLGAIRLTQKVNHQKGGNGGLKQCRPQLWQPFAQGSSPPAFFLPAQEWLPPHAIAPCSPAPLPVFL